MCPRGQACHDGALVHVQTHTHPREEQAATLCPWPAPRQEPCPLVSSVSWVLGNHKQACAHTCPTCTHKCVHTGTWELGPECLLQKTHLFVLVTQSCPTLCDSLDCSPPGHSVHGILQARILRRVAFPFSRGSLQPRAQTQVSCTTGRFVPARPPFGYIKPICWQSSNHSWLTTDLI